MRREDAVRRILLSFFQGPCACATESCRDRELGMALAACYAYMLLDPEFLGASSTVKGRAV